MPHYPLNSDDISYICLKIDTDEKRRLSRLVEMVFGDEICHIYYNHLTFA